MLPGRTYPDTVQARLVIATDETWPNSFISRVDVTKLILVLKYSVVPLEYTLYEPHGRRWKMCVRNGSTFRRQLASITGHKVYTSTSLLGIVGRFCCRGVELLLL